jgi:hypothetical protein
LLSSFFFYKKLAFDDLHKHKGFPGSRVAWWSSCYWIRGLVSNQDLGSPPHASSWAWNILCSVCKQLAGKVHNSPPMVSQTRESHNIWINLDIGSGLIWK